MSSTVKDTGVEGGFLDRLHPKVRLHGSQENEEARVIMEEWNLVQKVVVSKSKALTALDVHEQLRLYFKPGGRGQEWYQTMNRTSLFRQLLISKETSSGAEYFSKFMTKFEEKWVNAERGVLNLDTLAKLETKDYSAYFSSARHELGSNKGTPNITDVKKNAEENCERHVEGATAAMLFKSDKDYIRRAKELTNFDNKPVMPDSLLAEY